jgi:hypothetical protein
MRLIVQFSRADDNNVVELSTSQWPPQAAAAAVGALGSGWRMRRAMHRQQIERVGELPG